MLVFDEPLCVAFGAKRKQSTGYTSIWQRENNLLHLKHIWAALLTKWQLNNIISVLNRKQWIPVYSSWALFIIIYVNMFNKVFSCRALEIFLQTLQPTSVEGKYYYKLKCSRSSCLSYSSSTVLLTFHPETNEYNLLQASPLAGSCKLPC